MENNTKLRDLYDTFLDSGELISVMPESTGIWEQDKVLFQSIYSNLDESLLHGVDDDEEDDIYIEDDYYY